MAENLKTTGDWEALDKSRLTFAVEEIRKSQNLRYLFRCFLNEFNVTGTPWGDTPHEMAYAVGRHQAGTTIVSALQNEQPNLFAELLAEDAEEANQRQKVRDKLLELLEDDSYE